MRSPGAILHALNIDTARLCEQLREISLANNHMFHHQRVGSARDIFRGSGFILQMDHDIILLFSKCYEIHKFILCNTLVMG